MAVTRTPKAGDRSAFDVTNFPEVHASDLEADTPIHHVPAGATTGDTLRWDGAKWISETVVSVSIMLLATKEGELSVIASPFRIYNKYGVERTLTKVYLCVGTGPTGDDLIIDVSIDGVSVFLTGDSPTVLDGDVSGESTTFDNAAWPIDSYLTWEIAQVGSTVAGSDLTVHIVHE